MKANTNDSNKADSYLVSALIGMVYMIADKWRKSGYTESPETIALIAIKIIDPILQTWNTKLPAVQLS